MLKQEGVRDCKVALAADVLADMCVVFCKCVRVCVCVCVCVRVCVCSVASGVKKIKTQGFIDSHSTLFCLLTVMWAA